MLRTMKSLRGHGLLATDGALGKVDEFYFDDDEWIVRYLVADTGTWLPGRLVIISPQSVGRPNWVKKELPVSLTKKQIEQSPSIETERPVSRQHEQKIHGYFGWVPYWYDIPSPNLPGAPGPSADKRAPKPSAAGAPTATQGDPHLRSSREVIGYHIQATDDGIGHVEDFVVDSDDWTIRYMIVDTKNWLPGKKVLVPPTWIDSIRWADHIVRVDLTREQVEGSPQFDPKAPINREYETRLYDYYGRPCYW
jgi:uncharacterized protein YrrD